LKYLDLNKLQIKIQELLIKYGKEAICYLQLKLLVEINKGLLEYRGKYRDNMPIFNG